MKTQSLHEDKSHQYILVDDLNVATPIPPGEVFTGVIWTGLDRNAIFMPVVTPATDGSDGRLNVTITRAMTANISKGRYKLSVLDSQGRERVKDSIEFYEPVQLTSSVVGKVYCTYQDLLNIFPTLGKVASDNDETGFRRQREESFNWLNSQVIAKFSSSSRTWHTNGHYWCYCSDWYTGTQSSYDLDHIQALLNDGMLVTSQTVDNGQAVRISANKAVAEVLGSKLTSTELGDLDYGRFAEKCERRALMDVFGWQPRIDDGGTIIGPYQNQTHRPPPLYHYGNL